MHLHVCPAPFASFPASPEQRPRAAQACRRFVEAALPEITRVVRKVCTRHRVQSDDACEIVSALLLKVIDNDYAVIRQFDGRSDFRTYMYTVAHRFVLDYRNSQWGKWRPSAEARRIGRAAILLERFIIRDGFTAREAVESVSTTLALQSAEVSALADRLRLRVPARRAFEREIASQSPVMRAADAFVQRTEACAGADRVRTALAAALATLGSDDRGLLRLRFARGLSIARIAALARVDQKRLYRRFDSILHRLRQRLAKEGIERADLFNVVGHPEVEIGSLLGHASGHVHAKSAGERASVTRIRERRTWVELTVPKAEEQRQAAASGR